ncbi:MAG: D-alanine--D-alanine ligase [Chitinophagaceae bacterium]|nr:D-alanine--D-alanine ligase [Chitinophagaceae bacterium]MCW5929325.1 D-alanine--D-alanine ligase [Chitinophagaceae bacterium]
MKPNIAFVTGGYSGEAVVSYQSALTIEKNLDRKKYNIYTIDITREGWFYTADGEKQVVDKNEFTIKSGGKTIHFDAVLIGIHGTPGEDGKLQGYFDMLDLPYTSCDAATSALTFNKSYTVSIAAFRGIAVARSVLLIRGQFENADKLIAGLKFPVFVKPNNGGSSIGMSRVNSASEELGFAIEKAFKEDDQVLIEEFIEGREFTIGVFKKGGKIITLPITEVISKKEFFDYEAKYTKGMAEEITPAVIPGDLADKISGNAINVYRVFNCSGIVRMDFIYKEAEGVPYLLEINTVPGQSEASLVPQQVRAMGWTLTEFYSALIEEALLKKA